MKAPIQPNQNVNARREFRVRWLVQLLDCIRAMLSHLM